MHAVIIQHLEDYLAGTLPPWVERRFQGHMESCGGCRQEIQEIEGVRELVASLRSSQPVEPSAGFAARVIAKVPLRPLSFWNFFTDPAFGRRVVFASLLTLAVLGSILAARETSYASLPHSPDVVMATNQDSPTADTMLLTLASYEP